MEVADLNSSITEFIVLTAKILHHLPDLDSRQMYTHLLDEMRDYLSRLISFFEQRQSQFEPGYMSDDTLKLLHTIVKEYLLRTKSLDEMPVKWQAELQPLAAKYRQGVLHDRTQAEKNPPEIASEFSRYVQKLPLLDQILEHPRATGVELSELGTIRHRGLLARIVGIMGPSPRGMTSPRSKS